MSAVANLFVTLRVFILDGMEHKIKRYLECKSAITLLFLLDSRVFYHIMIYHHIGLRNLSNLRLTQIDCYKGGEVWGSLMA